MMRILLISSCILLMVLLPPKIKDDSKEFAPLSIHARVIISSGVAGAAISFLSHPFLKQTTN
jgi:hypothetical protein